MLIEKLLYSERHEIILPFSRIPLFAFLPENFRPFAKETRFFYLRNSATYAAIENKFARYEFAVIVYTEITFKT